jgi:hypothetical protein
LLPPVQIETNATPKGRKKAVVFAETCTYWRGLAWQPRPKHRQPRINWLPPPVDALLRAKTAPKKPIANELATCWFPAD